MTSSQRPACPQCGETRYVVSTSRVEVNRKVVTQRWACYYCLRPFDAEVPQANPTRRRRWLRRTLAGAAALSLSLPVLLRRRKSRDTARK